VVPAISSMCQCEVCRCDADLCELQLHTQWHMDLLFFFSSTKRTSFLRGRVVKADARYSTTWGVFRIHKCVESPAVGRPLVKMYPMYTFSVNIGEVTLVQREIHQGATVGREV
jgi:hypothetical protein